MVKYLINICRELSVFVFSSLEDNPQPPSVSALCWRTSWILPSVFWSWLDLAALRRWFLNAVLKRFRQYLWRELLMLKFIPVQDGALNMRVSAQTIWLCFDGPESEPTGFIWSVLQLHADWLDSRPPTEQLHPEKKPERLFFHKHQSPNNCLTWMHLCVEQHPCDMMGRESSMSPFPRMFYLNVSTYVSSAPEHVFFTPDSIEWDSGTSSFLLIGWEAATFLTEVP